MVVFALEIMGGIGCSWLANWVELGVLLGV